jgi:uncharacterized BrkB/YihY/UPF0761 family membrane protein
MKHFSYTIFLLCLLQTLWYAFGPTDRQAKRRAVHYGICSTVILAATATQSNGTTLNNIPMLVKLRNYLKNIILLT